MIVGLVAGVWTASLGAPLLGAVVGLVCALLWAEQKNLRARLERLELKQDRPHTASEKQARSSTKSAASEHGQDKAAISPSAPGVQPQIALREETQDLQPKRTGRAASKAEEFTGNLESVHSQAQPALKKKGDHEPAVACPNVTDQEEALEWGSDYQERPERQLRFTDGGPLSDVWSAIKNWFTTGNIPAKLGVLISFFGVAFLLKYAVERELLVVSIQSRLLAVSAGACGLFAFGWRLRKTKPAYALSLQGGAIGILYLTIYAALRLYELLPAGLAFGLLMLLTLAAGVLAVWQNARGLAWLAICGGFLAPVLVSLGSGSQTTLFSYYLVLNLAIFGIAWFRSWRELNLLGFVFTVLIGGAWLLSAYLPEQYGVTQVFVILFFLLFTAIAVLFAWRQTTRIKGFVDGSLVFATPMIGFGVQCALVTERTKGAAWSALALCLFYAASAFGLRRLKSTSMTALVQVFGGLSVVFGTLTFPLAFDGRWTSAAWAVEGAALVWIGVRQARAVTRAAGCCLVFASGFAFVTDDHGGHSDHTPLLNGLWVGGVLISVSALVSSWLLTKWLNWNQAPIVQRQPAVEPLSLSWQPIIRLVPQLLFAWGVLWWLGIGRTELHAHLSRPHELSAILGFFVASALGMAALARKLDWSMARFASLGLLPLMLSNASDSWLEHGHFAMGTGWLSWPAAFVGLYFVLKWAEPQSEKLLATCHVLAVLLLTFGLELELWWQWSDAPGVWGELAGCLIPVAVLSCIILLRKRFPWPIERYSNAYLVVACGLLAMMQVVQLMALNVLSNGDANPLPYLPLLNPLTIASILALWGCARWLQLLGSVPGELAAEVQASRRAPWSVLVVTAFLVSTLAVVRGVHHFGDVPWSLEKIAVSMYVQAALSIYWGVLSVLIMVRAAGKKQHTYWLMGAGLMGVVVLKLFLVDLGSTGSVARIVSFIGIGLLLLVVGYFAPVPPRRGLTSGAGDDLGAKPD